MIHTPMPKSTLYTAKTYPIRKAYLSETNRFLQHPYQLPYKLQRSLDMRTNTKPLKQVSELQSNSTEY